MKNIEKKSVKYLFILIFTTIIAGIIIYPLLDLLWDNFLSNTKFVYTIKDHIISPIIFGIIFGTLWWIIENRKK